MNKHSVQLQSESISNSELPPILSLSELVEAMSREFPRLDFSAIRAALAEIRDSRLYRSDFNTFEDYCREKWGWSKPYCTQIITASRVVKSLPEKAAVAIATESQARELAKVEPTKRVEVLAKAAELGPVTL